jgi:hypothetical protein
MTKVRNYRPLIIILAIISVIGITFGGYTYIHRASIEMAYVYNCGIVDFKPDSLTPYCADAGAGITGIDWETWNANGATGTAEYTVNTCEPNCASGTWKYAEVTFTLTKPVRDKGKTVLSRIDIATKDGKNLPLSNSPSLGWDLERKPL